MTTTPTIMDGKAVSQQVLDRTALRVKQIVAKTGVQPCLATILVGDDPASATYVKMKQRRCHAVGMRSVAVDLPTNTSTQQLVDKVSQLGADPGIHGILLQHPVPHQIDERAAFEAIPAAKDVDGVTTKSFGTIAFDLPLGEGGAGYACCTPAGIMILLKTYKVDLVGKHAVVIGRSAILGKPMAMMLLAAHATVTICHSRTKNLAEIVRQGDVVVAAVGKPKFVQGSWVKPGAVVIDAGYTQGNVGDIDFDAVAQHASMITPVPGGVGPMTIAVLLDQCVTAAAKQLRVTVD